MTNPIRVLVVDDEERIRDGCQRLLTSQGYQVALAENGQVALEMLAAEELDLVLLDLKMPVMGGEEVLGIAHQRYPDIPIIIITGHGTIDTAVECMKKGAYDFITKPFQMRPFMITINRAAEKRRLELQARLLQQENIRNLYDLRLEKGRLTTIVNCLANGVMVTNRQLEVVLHNPALTRLLNIENHIELPAPLNRFLADPAVIDTLERIQSGEIQSGAVPTREITIGGRYLRAITAPVIGPTDNVTGTVTVLEDITAFKQLDQMKSDFINMVAHELRSPLSSVRQLLNVQIEGLCGPLTEKQTDYLSRSIKRIDGLLDLIRDLLEISKAEVGMLVKVQAPVDLEEMLRSMLGLMEARAKAQGIELILSTPGAPPILGDAKSIESVFNNLVSNAINYSPDGGRVEVHIEEAGDHVQVRVADTGVGITPEELAKIFTKFYRVKHPRTRQVVGTGLGLSLVKNIVETHQGHIEVESEPQKGTTFRVFLPVMK